MSLPKAELVVKSNRLIEASYRLGLNEQRIILYAICRCREEQTGLLPDLPVTITADAFAHQFPSIDKTNVYRQLKEAMDALYDRSVTIHDVDPASGHARVKKTRWVSEAAYVDGAGNVQVIFTPEVIKYITRLEAEFTSYLPAGKSRKYDKLLRREDLRAAKPTPSDWAPDSQSDLVARNAWPTTDRIQTDSRL